MAKCIWKLKGETYKWFDLSCGENYKREIPYELVCGLTKFGNLKYCFWCGREIANLNDRLKEQENA